MPTPLFKVLANSIRLGQPPDPVLAIKALVDVISHQENELNDLKQRLSMLQSRLHFLEAKTSRIEAVSLLGGPSSVVAPSSAPSERPPPMPRAMLNVPNPMLPKPEPLPSIVPLDEDSSGGEAAGTLVVSRADIDAVVRQVVENEAPYPLAPPGGHRKQQDSALDMPFKAPSRPPPNVDGDRTRQRSDEDLEVAEMGSDPYLPIDDTFASTAEGQAVNINDLGREIRHGSNPPLIDDASFDDQVLTSILKRKK